MPKYQIILYSNKQLADDEFLEYAGNELLGRARLAIADFKLISAQNLEGLREEVYTYVNRNPDSQSYGALISKRKPIAASDFEDLL